MSTMQACKPLITRSYIDQLSLNEPARNYSRFQQWTQQDLHELQHRSYKRLHELQQEVDRLLDELRQYAARSSSLRNEAQRSRLHRRYAG